MKEHVKSRLSITGWAMVLTVAMALGSCSSDETLDLIEPKAITFGDITLQNASRATDPSYGDSKPIDQFQVWGSVKGNTNTTVNIFSGANVTNTYKTDASKNYGYGQAWTCDVVQYWIPSAEYNFMAISNATSVTTGTAGMPTDIKYTADGVTDLLLSNQVTAKTDGSATPISGVTNGCVTFNMTHLLSKVHFTFHNADESTPITNIKITGHYQSGTYNINSATWSNQVQPATNSPLSFGDDATTNPVTSEHTRLIIPGTQSWEITFNLNDKPYEKTLKLKDFTFAPNREYNIVVTLGFDASLSVNVQDWNGVTIPNNFSEDVSVDTSDGQDGTINWINSDELTIEGDKVAFKQGHDSARFKFKLAGPLGGTWYAMLVTQQGKNEAFQISPAQGEVGKEYTVTITTNDANNTREANMAELRFIVRQGGKVLPVDCLTKFEGNYIIVQNPAIN